MPSNRKPFRQKIIALIYDFDETLSPETMQNYALLPKLKQNPKTFWAEVKKETKDKIADGMLTYLRLLLDKSQISKEPIKQIDLVGCGRTIKYYPGVETWFNRINRHVKSKSKGRIELRHYIISAGIKDVLDGTSIRKYFFNVFGSKYHFNHNGIPDFLTLLITDTTKTQFLFRINKNIEDIRESINEHMDEAERLIPFSNMIYIGDGLSDVPCMTLVKKSGGHSIAVYDAKPNKKQTCLKLLNAGRVDFIAKADYRKSSSLTYRVKLLLNSVMANIAYQRELHRS